MTTESTLKTFLETFFLVCASAGEAATANAITIRINRRMRDSIRFAQLSQLHRATASM